VTRPLVGHSPRRYTCTVPRGKVPACAWHYTAVRLSIVCFCPQLVDSQECNVARGEDHEVVCARRDVTTFPANSRVKTWPFLNPLNFF
jgi:hypothetical protein